MNPGEISINKENIRKAIYRLKGNANADIQQATQGMNKQEKALFRDAMNLNIATVAEAQQIFDAAMEKAKSMERVGISSKSLQHELAHAFAEFKLVLSEREKGILQAAIAQAAVPTSSATNNESGRKHVSQEGEACAQESELNEKSIKPQNPIYVDASHWCKAPPLPATLSNDQGMPKSSYGELPLESKTDAQDTNLPLQITSAHLEIEQKTKGISSLSQLAALFSNNRHWLDIGYENPVVINGQMVEMGKWIDSLDGADIQQRGLKSEYYTRGGKS